ncbi:hypothetical protein [Halorarius halobius]|uniref:hypothetical protein n=1 Tax=Halorarius halobius TaxID=2962671 RepID=UPI0020CBE5E9|nr:hypothetical protein [Halorarius halobius]
MNTADEGPGDLDGMALDAAVEQVVAADPSRDREAVRSALEYVAEEGVVTDAAVEDAFAHLSKVVATPETRVELAGDALADAHETAAPVADVDTVAARLDAFGTRVDNLEARVDDLGADLQSALDAREGSLYETAERVRELTERANGLQRAADDLQLEIEEFETWLTDEESRLDAVAADLESVTESVDDLEARAADLEAGNVASDAAVEWADATVARGVTALLVADIRAELDDLRTWPGGVDAERRLSELDRDAERMADRLDALDGRLESVDDDGWHDRFEHHLDPVDAVLSGAEPPVDWGAVHTEVRPHRAAIRDAG